MKIPANELFNTVYMRGRTNERSGAPVHTMPAPHSVREMMHDQASGATANAHGGAPTLSYKMPAPHLQHFERGPVGLLQWLATAHPTLFKRLQKDRPDLLQAARGMAKAHAMGACPGAKPSSLSGLAAATDPSTWYDSLLNYTGKVLNLYGTYKAIQSGQQQQVQNDIQKQVQNAQQNLPPQQLGPVSDNTPPPDPNTVTEPSPKHSGGFGTVATVGGLVAGGLILKMLFF